MGKYGKSNRGSGYSGQIKLGNSTIINDGYLPTTVQQINLAFEAVNKNSKRYVVGSKNTSNNSLSLQQNHLSSLICSDATSCACCCVPADSAPSYTISFYGKCPTVNYYDCSAAVRGTTINFTQNSFYVNTSFKVCWSGIHTKTCQTNGTQNCNGSGCPNYDSGCNGPNGTTYCYADCGTTCN
jgi:hypothetical protein